jgi:predicted ATPase
MDLLYLWTRKFKNITEQGFSFSDKFLIRYDTVKMELQIKENPQFIPHFFPGNITSVTGIIGANGAGKSNLFELLKYTLGSFEEGLSAVYKELKSVVVFEKEIFYHKDLKISNTAELKKLGFSIFSYRDSLAMYYDENGVRQNLVMGSGNIYSNGHIFYCNNFDGRTDHYHRPTVDISTNNLIWEDKTNQRRSKDRYSFDKSEMDSRVAFEIEETERQIDFLATNNFELPIRLPSSVTVKIEEDYNRFISIYRNWFEDHGLSAHKDVDRPRFPPEKEVEQATLKPLLASAFIYKLLIVLQFNDPELYKPITVGQFYTIIYERDFSVLSELYSAEMLEHITGTVRLFEQLIQVGVVYERERESLTLFELYDSFGVQLNEVNRKLLLDFHRHYYQAVQGHSFLVFYWGGLSSGEYTLLSLYARFNWAFKSYFVQDKKQLIIMIDEGELSLHPSWQASLLYNLMLYFNQRMPDVLIQIIATSHSPFLVSDLPKSMINFLDKDAQGNCLVVDGVNLQKQTFGANIHTLYADAFFMNNTLMGKFAKTKLDRLIGIINREREFDREFPDWATVRKTVELIGEPILRGLLQRQLAAVVAIDDNDLEDLRQQMQLLNVRIRRLEGRDNDPH